MVTHVLLIRHGQSEGNAAGRFGGHTDTPLSFRGRQQAERTARALASEEFAAIYSSDLPRAVETAMPLVKLTGAQLITSDAFRERSVGVMEGLTFEEAAAEHPEQSAVQRPDTGNRPSLLPVARGQGHAVRRSRAAPDLP